MAKNIRLLFDEAVIDMLAEKGYDPKMGARPLSRKIDELIRVPLSRRILFDRLSDCSIRTYIDNDQIQFETTVAKHTAVVDNQGYILIDQVDPQA